MKNRIQHSSSIALHRTVPILQKCFYFPQTEIDTAFLTYHAVQETSPHFGIRTVTLNWIFRYFVTVRNIFDEITYFSEISIVYGGDIESWQKRRIFAPFSNV